MSNSGHQQNPEFLKYVYELIEGDTLNQALDKSLKDIEHIDVLQLKSIGLRTYEEGKWTIHTIMQHLIDWERIWCYRAVLFARAEGGIPVAHDQEIMGKHSNADEQPIEQLLNELNLVRQSTISMFRSFNEQILSTSCIFFEYEMTITEIGLTIVAHQKHHFNIIDNRYRVLAD